MSTNPYTRTGNLVQLFPFGTTVYITLATKNELDEDGYGKLIFSDALGIAIQEDGKPVFYPWSNIVRIQEAGE